MKPSFVRVVVLVVAAVAGFPPLLRSQQSVTLGVSAGVAPVIQGRNLPYETGTHVQLSAERPQLIGRLGVRAEIFFARFPRNTLNGALSGTTTLPGASLQLVLPLTRPTALVRPYLLAGGGTYRTDLGGGPEFHFGINGGGGVQFGRGRFAPFVETRLLRIMDGGTPRAVPVSIGFRF